MFRRTKGAVSVSEARDIQAEFLRRVDSTAIEELKRDPFFDAQVAALVEEA